MDFDQATSRLKKDHEALRSRANRRPQTLASNKATLEAQKRQEYRQKQIEKKKQVERLEKLKLGYVQRGFDNIETKLGIVRTLGEMNSSSHSSSLMLEATSIHGQGDKITLPPSLLSTLASRDLLYASQENGQPLFFRLGIRRSGYVFPSSDKMKDIMNKYTDKRKQQADDADMGIKVGQIADNDFDRMDDDIDDDVDDDDDEHKQMEWEEAYLDELSHEYISYVYATVIEFSQDEGSIGLPKSAAHKLLSLHQNNGIEQQQQTIQSKFTIDPASVTLMDIDEVEQKSDEVDHKDSLESKTPGHPAYGLFPVPVDKIEVTLLTSLPFGKKCTLQPTLEAIQNGFYNLKDVKLVLEQSLIRTRGCLNLGDIVHVWHRGKKFDLCVKDLSPSRVGAISCVNTDVEVDFAALDDGGDVIDNQLNGDGSSSNISAINKQSGRALSGGYTLRSDVVQQDGTVNVEQSTTTVSDNDILKDLIDREVPAEPPLDQKENVITFQIRGDGGKQCRRRFDSSKATMEDIFSFVVLEQLSEKDFCLVTRFPRRVFTLKNDGNKLLSNMDFSPQELLLVETRI